MLIPNMGMRSALRPSVQSYRHFTGIFAYGMAYTKKPNDGISTWDFAHRQVYSWVEYPENFISKECFLPEILKFQKTENSSILRGIWAIFKTLISREGNILLSWNFQGILLTNRPICGQSLRPKYRHSISCRGPCHTLKFDYSAGRKA